MKLLSFELKKIIFDKKFLYLSLILALIIVILFMRNIAFQGYVEKEEVQEVEHHISTSEAHKTSLENTLKLDPDNENLQLQLSILNEMLDVLYHLRDIVGTGDWQAKLQLENDFLSYVTEFKTVEGDYPLTTVEVEQSIALNQKLLDENIKPEHETFSLALPNFLKVIVSLLLNIGAIIIIIIFIGDILSSEYENHSINFLLTQPVNRLNILISKFINSIFVYLFLMCIFFGIAFIIGRFFGVEGTFNYPILIEKNNEIQFITIRDYIYQGTTIISVVVLSIISLSLFISLFLKHTLATLLTLAGILLAGFVITFIPWDALFWLNPFQYTLAEEMILMQNEKVWYQGIPATVLLTIACLVIGLQKIRVGKIG